MMHFLKSKGGRVQSQHQVDLGDHASAYSTADVDDDWSTTETVLTDDEAAEIQRAFQQQVDVDVAMLDDFAVTLEDAPSTVVESVADESLLADDTAVVIQANDVSQPASVTEDVVVAELDPLDLNQLNMKVSTLTDLPEDLSLLSVATPVAEMDEQCLDVVVQENAESDVTHAIVVTEMGESAAEPVSELAVADGGVLPESMPSLVEYEPTDLAVTSIDSVADAAIVAIELPSESPELMHAARMATAEADDANGDDSSSEGGPLTYFQYYLDESLTDSGNGSDAPAPYVTPWRQPSVPGGLIGAGVLGATLVSGFVIADTVKMQPLTTAKKPTPPSPKQSLSAKDQITAVATPQAVPPEVMQPEVALPKPTAIVPSSSTVASLPSLGQANAALPLAIAMAPTTAGAVSNPIASSGAVKTLPSQANAAIAAPESTPDVPLSSRSIGDVPLTQMQVPPIETAQLPTKLPQPAVPVDADSQPTVAAGADAEGAPTQPSSAKVLLPVTSPTSDLPQLQPDSSVSKVDAAQPGEPADTMAVETPVVEPNSRPVAVDAPSPDAKQPNQIAPVAATEVAPPANVVVPTEVATPTVESPTPTASMPGDRVFTRDTALVPTPNDAPAAKPPLPTVVEGTSSTAPVFEQPVLDGATTDATPAQPAAVSSVENLPPQIQTLLTKPNNRGYQPVASQWRSLTQQEARIASRAQQLGEFTRRQLTKQDYVNAYRALSQQVDALPPFGFIDYQRQLILLPPQPTTASNGVLSEQSRSIMQSITANMLTI